MKRILFSSILVGIVSTCYANITPFCNGTLENPCLVQDTLETIPALKHFRHAGMLADAYPGNKTGLSNLWVSGSGAPNGQGWQQMMEIIKNYVGSPATIIDVDLRQETHGYVNDNSINLTVEYNWINLGKSLVEIEAAEKDWLGKITAQDAIDNVLTSSQFKSKDYTHGVTVPIVKVEPEADLVKNLGYQYIRLPVTDHRAPLDNEVDQFVALVKNLPANTWLHLHCRGGDGRTTTFMAMVDMLKNADKVAFAEIIQRQAAVDPFYDLSDVDRDDAVLSQYYKERYEFLKKFYQFSLASLQGYKGKWSEWHAQSEASRRSQ